MQTVCIIYWPIVPSRSPSTTSISSGAVNSDSSSKIIDSGTKGDTNYFFYEHDGSTKEYNYIIEIENSDTVVILGNTESEESAKNVFENLEISLEE